MQQTYRTYISSKKDYKRFRPIAGSAINKPCGGLWGCRGSEWDDWCKCEEFRTHIGYYEWHLKVGSKIYTIENENDFFYLVKNYPHDDGIPIVDTIDYLKLKKDGYDAVELTEEANRKMHFAFFNPEDYKSVLAQFVLHNGAMRPAVMMGLNSWDVPSICVFDPEKTVEVTSNVLT